MTEGPEPEWDPGRTGFPESDRHLMWLGVAVAHFFVSTVLFVWMTASFFSLGDDLGSGVITFLAGAGLGLIQAPVATLLLAGTYYSRGNLAKATLGWAGALFATTAMGALLMVVLGCGATHVVRTLVIYAFTPGGEVLPRAVSRLLRGLLVSSVSLMTVDCAAGILLARWRFALGGGPGPRGRIGRVRRGWRIVMGLGAAAAMTLATLSLAVVIIGRPSAIHRAVVAGDIERTRALLEADPELVKAKDWQKKTALHLAAESGQLDMAKLLLERGADANVSDMHGTNPLHISVRKAHTEVVELILLTGGNVNAKARADQTPLHMAARGGHTAIVALLLSHGADVNAKQVFRRDTPLDLAEHYGHADVVELLRAHGALEK